MADSKTILVPLDGSRFAEWAVPGAVGLAKAIHARVELVSVFAEEPVVAGWQPTKEEIQERVGTYLDGVVERIAKVANAEIGAGFGSGPVIKTLEDYIANVRPHLVVMSTHGRGPLSRA